jgi:hypothetical protein
MLTRLQRTATIIVLAICFAIAIAGEIWEASHSPQAPQQGATTYNADKTSHTSQKESPEEVIARYTETLAWFTGVLSFATILIGAMNGFQLWLARAEYISTHRPIIRVRRVALSAFGAMFGADNFSHGDDVEIEFIVSNVGSGDAIITGGLYRIYCFNTPEPKNDSLFGEYAHKIPGAIDTLASGEAKRLFVNSKVVLTEPPPGQRIMRQFSVEHWRMHVLGQIDYRDSLGRKRQTGFLRELQPGGAFRRIEDRDYEYED